MSSSNATYIFNSASFSSCSTKLSTVVKKINSVQNHENATIISHLHDYMAEKGSSENHQVNTLKVIIELANYLGPTNFKQICKREEITSFLNKKIKTQELQNLKTVKIIKVAVDHFISLDCGLS